MIRGPLIINKGSLPPLPPLKNVNSFIHWLILIKFDFFLNWVKVINMEFVAFLLNSYTITLKWNHALKRFKMFALAMDFQKLFWICACLYLGLIFFS